MRALHFVPTMLLALGLCPVAFASPGHPPAVASLAAAGPWVAQHDASSAFTTDGDTVVFTRGRGLTRRLYVARRHGGNWSAPQCAPFSNRWMDMEPAMAPDGSYLVFVSNRPAHGEGKVLDGDWGGQLRPGRGGNLWRVNRVGDGWGTPRRLPDNVNASVSTYSPAVAADGSLYFVRADPSSGVFRLYRSHLVNGRYRSAQSLALGSGDATSNYDPAVAPDQSFLIFSSDRAPAAPNGGDLFIAFAAAGRWSKPADLGLAGDEARLGPDRKTLYFSAPDHRIHRIPLARWLTRRQQAAH